MFIDHLSVKRFNEHKLHTECDFPPPPRSVFTEAPSTAAPEAHLEPGNEPIMQQTHGCARGVESSPKEPSDFSN